MLLLSQSEKLAMSLSHLGKVVLWSTYCLSSVYGTREPVLHVCSRGVTATCGFERLNRRPAYRRSVYCGDPELSLQIWHPLRECMHNRFPYLVSRCDSDHVDPASRLLKRPAPGLSHVWTAFKVTFTSSSTFNVRRLDLSTS